MTLRLVNEKHSEILGLFLAVTKRLAVREHQAAFGCRLRIFDRACEKCNRSGGLGRGRGEPRQPLGAARADSLEDIGPRGRRDLVGGSPQFFAERASRFRSLSEVRVPLPCLVGEWPHFPKWPGRSISH